MHFAEHSEETAAERRVVRGLAREEGRIGLHGIRVPESRAGRGLVPGDTNVRGTVKFVLCEI